MASDDGNNKSSSRCREKGQHVEWQHLWRTWEKKHCDWKRWVKDSARMDCSMYNSHVCTWLLYQSNARSSGCPLSVSIIRVEGILFKLSIKTV